MLRMKKYVLLLSENLSKKPIYFFFTPFKRTNLFILVLGKKHGKNGSLQSQVVPHIFSSTSFTCDATTFPSTTSSTIVLIFLVLVGSEHHKGHKANIEPVVTTPHMDGCVEISYLFQRTMM